MSKPPTPIPAGAADDDRAGLVRLIMAMAEQAPVDALWELERAIRVKLMSPPDAGEVRRVELGELARMLPPPILGSLPMMDRAYYDLARDPSAPSSHALVRRYGSWIRAGLAASAAAPNGAVRGPHHPWLTTQRGRPRPQPYTDWEISEAIRRCADQTGHRPSSATYHKWALERRRDARAKGLWPIRIPNYSSVRRRRGGFNAVVDAALDEPPQEPEREDEG